MVSHIVMGMGTACVPVPGGPIRYKACSWPPAVRSVLTRSATRLSMPMSRVLPVSCGSVFIAGVYTSLLRPLHINACQGPIPDGLW